MQADVIIKTLYFYLIVIIYVSTKKFLPQKDLLWPTYIKSILQVAS